MSRCLWPSIFPRTLEALTALQVAQDFHLARGCAPSLTGLSLEEAIRRGRSREVPTKPAAE